MARPGPNCRAAGTLSALMSWRVVEERETSVFAGTVSALLAPPPPPLTTSDGSGGGYAGRSTVTDNWREPNPLCPGVADFARDRWSVSDRPSPEATLPRKAGHDDTTQA
ncbi:hypothetical protein MRX96_003802 [Rhipicephalus microplus]